ncbi:MAG TPA: hypothetical protein VNK95_06890 [Caldilineaceae bacterium]|nr:hypothetical protein [Caldilineaceae bacterium]
MRIARLHLTSSPTPIASAPKREADLLDKLGAAGYTVIGVVILLLPMGMVLWRLTQVGAW